MNILLLAYACEPNKGSEPGVGWNLSLALSQKHRVIVLTRKNNQNCIEEYLSCHPTPNLSFIYHDLPSWLVRIKKKIGTQAYYLLWNISAIKIVKDVIKVNKPDIIHHLTFNQYRTPSVGYFFNLPFVVGPIGGAETINPIFDGELDKSTLKRENYRRRGKDFPLFKWLTNRSTAPKAFLFSAEEDATRLARYTSATRDIVRVVPSIAIDENDFCMLQRDGSASQPFTMVYAGRALDWKGLHLFLLSLSKCASSLQNSKAQLIGIQSEEERKKVNRWVSQYGLSALVEVIDFMPRKELLQCLTKADLFVYPAFRDSGSMAVLEACAIGCPCIAFDAGGQDAFPDNILLKVKIGSSFESTVDAFSEKLLWGYNNREKLHDFGRISKQYAFSSLTWNRKAEVIDTIYKEILNTRK